MERIEGGTARGEARARFNCQHEAGVRGHAPSGRERPVPDQPLLLSPAQPLDGQLPLQGRRLRRLGLRVGQSHGEPAAGVSGCLAGSVGLEFFGEVVVCLCRASRRSSGGCRRARGRERGGQGDDLKLPPQATGDLQAKSLDGLRKTRTISLRENSDRVMNQPGINRDDFQESNGRRPGQTYGGPAHQGHVERIARLVRRDAGQQDIIRIDCQHHSGAAFPTLQVREGKLHRHNFAGSKSRHTRRRPASRP